MEDINSIIRGLEKKNRELTALTDQYIDYAEKRAQSERNYNIAMAQKTLAYKIEGHPATLISTLVKGDKVVADLKFELDVSDGMYKATRERMNDVRAAIDSYRSILAWKRAEFERG